MTNTNLPGASSPEVKTMKVAFFALAIGTAVEGFTQGISLFGESIGGIIAAILAALVFVTLFDLTATKNIFKVAMHFTKQKPVGKKVWIFVTAALIGIVGTMMFSQLSVPVIADVAAGDTDSDKVMQTQKAKAENRHDARVKDISAEVAKAEKREREAKAFITPTGRRNWSPAKEQAVKAQGGSFASEALSGSAWVWTADATAHKGRRAAVAAAEKAALAEYEAARAELAHLRQVKAGMVSASPVDAATALVLQTQGKRFDGWMFKKATMRTVTMVVVWGSLVVILISVFVQVAEGKVEEIRTISDVAADALEGIHDAVIEIMDAGQRSAQWIRSNTFGLIPPLAGGTPVPRQSVSPVSPVSVPPLAPAPAVSPVSRSGCIPCTPKSCPPATGDTRVKYTEGERRRLEKIKGYIKTYRKRGTPPRKEWLDERDAIHAAANARIKNRKQ